MRLTFYNHFKDKATNANADLEWSQVVKLLTTHDRRAEKDGPGFSPATFTDTCRCGGDACPGERGHAIKLNARAVHLLGLDLDKTAEGVDLTQEQASEHIRHLKGLGIDMVLHSTYSHAPPERSSWRVFVRLSRPVSPAEFKTFWRGALVVLGVPSGIKTDSPARFWYLPACPEGAEPKAAHFQGTPLDVDQCIRAAPDIVEAEAAEYSEPPPAIVGVLRAALYHLGKHGPAIEGAGGDAHAFRACSIVKNDWAVPWEQGKYLLAEWNKSNLPPWELDELERKWGLAESDENFGQLRDGHLFIKSLEANEDKGEPGSYQEALILAAKDWDAEVKADENKERVRVPMFMRGQAFQAVEFPPTPWLVNGIATKGGVGALATEPKSGKTWAATAMALSVAAGLPAFGQYDVEQGQVGYFYAEDMGTSVKARALALAKGMGLEGIPDALLLQPRGRDLDLQNDENMIEVIASVRLLGGVKLLVLDPLRDLHSGAEDSSDDMSRVMKRIRVLARVLDASVLFVHHSGKSSSDGGSRRPGQRMRGSGAIHGAVDYGMYFSSLVTGNEGQEITNTVDYEVKAARAAGRCKLKLTMEDDKYGVAQHAIYSVGKCEEEDTESPGIADIVRALGMREGVGESAPTDREMIGLLKGGAQNVRIDLASAEKAGYVVKHKSPMGAVTGWKLTPLGHEFYAVIDK